MIVTEINEQHNGTYHLGIGFICPQQKLLMENTISLPTFYKYSETKITKYLFYHSTSYINWPRLEIMKMDFHKQGGFLYYSCIFKTFYLRIIQRRWKNIFKQRIAILANTKTIHNFITQRQCGVQTTLKLPGLRGMLI
jgi:hypothetical protein